MPTAWQVRATRGITGMSRKALAEAAGVSPDTIRRAEHADTVDSISVRLTRKIEAAISGAGIKLVGNGVAPAQEDAA